MRRMTSDPSTIRTNVLARPAWARVALVAAIVAASLWDFRLHDLRVFDLAAFVFLLAFFVLDLDVGRGWLVRRAYILPMIAVIICYAVIGFMNFHHRSSLAIIFLAAIGLQLAGYKNIVWIERVFRGVVYLNVAALLVQYFAYYLFHTVLDPQRLFGVVSRIFYGNELRPAGLFQEPNSFCLNLFVVATLALFAKRDRVLALVAAGAMLLSQSLWGIVGAFVLVALNEWNASETLAKKARVTLVLWAAIFVGFNAYLWLGKPAKRQMPVLYTRVFHLGTDASARDRYGAIIDRTPHFHARGRSARSSSRKTRQRWLAVVGWQNGHGLSTAVFLGSVAANGLSFMWYCFGLAGLVLMIGTFGLTLSGVTLRAKLYTIASVVFIFTTYPLVTYAIFWIWLPGLLMLARQHSEESRRVMS